MEIIRKIKENFWWCLIIIIIMLVSIPSLYRIYQIRFLYLSSKVRTEAVAANVALREDYGIGATDLKLKKILVTSDQTIFYFDYFYHGMGALWGKDKKTFLVKFDSEDKVRIETL